MSERSPRVVGWASRASISEDFDLRLFPAGWVFVVVEAAVITGLVTGLLALELGTAMSASSSSSAASTILRFGSKLSTFLYSVMFGAVAASSRVSWLVGIVGPFSVP